MENNYAKQLRDYETPYLFLLIGTNPLPNYVAAKLLWDRDEENAKLFFVYTKDTKKYVDTLISELALKVCDNLVLIDVVDESDTKKIYDGVCAEVQKLKENAVNDKKIGLNYTGGTKTMAVHAYRAVREFAEESYKTYLDARSLSMVIEKEGEKDDRIPTRDLLEMNIDTFLALHSYEYKIENGRTKRPRSVDELRYPNLARDIAKNDLIEKIHDWSQRNYRSIRYNENIQNNQKIEAYKALALPFPDLLKENYEDCSTVDEFSIKTGDKPEKVCLYFDGDWLEEYVLLALSGIKSDPKDYSCGIDVKPRPINGVDFQIDDFAIKGYQLFAISCGTGKKRGDLKTKLFEVLVRARQIGGDEARVALVCGIEDPKCLQNELTQSWNLPDGMVRVFGKNEIPKLSNEFFAWIENQEKGEVS